MRTCASVITTPSTTWPMAAASVTSVPSPVALPAAAVWRSTNGGAGRIGSAGSPFAATVPVRVNHRFSICSAIRLNILHSRPGGPGSHLIKYRSQMPLGFKLRADSVQLLRCADHQAAVRLERPLHASKQRDPVPIREVDRHVAAEDQVESPQSGKIRHQVQFLEGSQCANLVPNLPTAAGGREVSGPLDLAQAARDLHCV